MFRKVERYGWRPDTPDHRDFIFNERNAILPARLLPSLVDLSPKMPPIYDQGQLGSCTGNGWARVMEYMEMQQGEGTHTPSRLFIYYEERFFEGTIGQDAGAEVRTGARVVSSIGAPPESYWPYDITRFAQTPPQTAYDQAKKHEALEYQRILVGGPGAPIRTALSKGLPIVFGFSVPDYFENGWGDDGGTDEALPVPGPDDQIIGGHCVVMTGYDFTRKNFPVNVIQCDNSWGTFWGVNGRFYMDARWFNTNLASDYWVVQKVT